MKRWRYSRTLVKLIRNAKVRSRPDSQCPTRTDCLAVAVVAIRKAKYALILLNEQER